MQKIKKLISLSKSYIIDKNDYEKLIKLNKKQAEKIKKLKKTNDHISHKNSGKVFKKIYKKQNNEIKKLKKEIVFYQKTIQNKKNIFSEDKSKINNENFILIKKKMGLINLRLENLMDISNDLNNETINEICIELKRILPSLKEDIQKNFQHESNSNK